MQQVTSPASRPRRTTPFRKADGPQAQIRQPGTTTPTMSRRVDLVEDSHTDGSRVGKRRSVVRDTRRTPVGGLGKANGLGLWWVTPSRHGESHPRPNPRQGQRTAVKGDVKATATACGIRVPATFVSAIGTTGWARALRVDSQTAVPRGSRRGWHPLSVDIF